MFSSGTSGQQIFRTIIPLTRMGVLLVDLILGEHPQEDILGEDVLEQHLPHVRRCDGRPDGLPAQVEGGQRRFLNQSQGEKCRDMG